MARMGMKAYGSKTPKPPSGLKKTGLIASPATKAPIKFGGKR